MGMLLDLARLSAHAEEAATSVAQRADPTPKFEAAIAFYRPDPSRAPTRSATEAERRELADLIAKLGEPLEYREEALRLALLDPDAALECFRRIVKEIT